MFVWSVNQVTEAHHQADEDKSNDIFAEVFKLFGNLSYGKLFEALDRQTNTSYTKYSEISV